MQKTQQNHALALDGFTFVEVWRGDSFEQRPVSTPGTARMIANSERAKGATETFIVADGQIIHDAPTGRSECVL